MKRLLALLLALVMLLSLAACGGGQENAKGKDKEE
jgi:predicted small lipoprotein YifL